MPSTIEQAHRQWRQQGFVVVAIDIQESREQVAAWVKQKGVTVQVLLDRDGAVTARQGWVLERLPGHTPGPSAMAAAREFERRIDETFEAVLEEANGRAR